MDEPARRIGFRIGRR